LSAALDLSMGGLRVSVKAGVFAVGDRLVLNDLTRRI
jgi:hypothetical protein